MSKEKLYKGFSFFQTRKIFMSYNEEKNHSHQQKFYY
nr:MAG TPA: hypothetical protein [Caudoviricetes sp.]